MFQAKSERAPLVNVGLIIFCAQFFFAELKLFVCLIIEKKCVLGVWMFTVGLSSRKY